MPRVRIAAPGGEFEVEGPEEFIDRFSDQYEELLERLMAAPAVPASAAPTGSPTANPAINASPQPSGDTPPPPFGEFVHQLPTDASHTDLILAAGYYVQKTSVEGNFATNEVSTLLQEQGYKLSNPSQSLKNNLSAKKVFKVTGKRWKVSKPGEEHLKSLGVSL